MFCTIINDCLDGNAVGRQCSRVASLVGVSPTFVGVGGKLSENNAYDRAEIEAAGCLVDVLDATEGREGLVLVNVANRHAKGKRWENGTPFGYFWHGETLVVSTIDGVVLSLIKKMGISDHIKVMDVGRVMHYMANDQFCTREVAEHVTHTQFRSYDFTPRVGAYLLKNREVPHNTDYFAVADYLVEISSCVWYIDNFGNVKTTVLPSEVNFGVGKKIGTIFGELLCYERLKDVPNGETGLIIGSSGIGEKRFVELVVQGVSAADKYGLSVGQKILA
jgi:hypothetical protein